MYLSFSVEKYLGEIQSQMLQNGTGINTIPIGTHIRDDEQVSFIVLICAIYDSLIMFRKKISIMYVVVSLSPA